MIAHKYFRPMDGRRQEVLTSGLCRVATGQGRKIPAVVTVEADRLTVGWWNVSEGRWKSWPRPHDELHLSGITMAKATSWNWSTGTAFAAHGGRAFLCYKRGITADDVSDMGLFLDVLEHDVASNDLKPLTPQQPIEIPLKHWDYDRCGLWVWAGVLSQPEPKLALLFQAVRIEQLKAIQIEQKRTLLETPWLDPNLWEAATKYGISLDELVSEVSEKRVAKRTGLTYVQPKIAKYELVLLTADPTVSAAELGQAATWSHTVLDKGGFDLHAVGQGDRITCVYRRDKHALTVTATVDLMDEDEQREEIPIPSDPMDDSVWAPLTVRSMTFDQGGLQQTAVEMPGGLNPRLQHFDPLMLTVDRVRAGNVLAIPKRRIQNYFLEYVLPPSATVTITQVDKVLFQRWRNTWFRGRLFQHVHVLPRNLKRLYAPRGSFHGDIMDVDGRTRNISMSRLESFLPCTLISYQSDPDDKEWDRIGVLRHRPEREDLAIEWWRIRRQQETLEMEPEQAYNVLDINHKRLTQEVAEIAPEELDQFDWLESVRGDVDTTIGGAVAVDQASQKLDFYAYTDLADGGLRIIYDDDLSTPDPQTQPTEDKEGMEPGQVAGTGTGEDFPVEIGWDGYAKLDLPSYPVTYNWGTEEYQTDGAPHGALWSRIQVPLEILLKLLEEITSQNPPTFVITPDVAAGIQDWVDLIEGGLSIWDMLWTPFEEIAAAENSNEFSIDSGTLSIDRYKLKYECPDGTRKSIRIEVRDHNALSACLEGQYNGQGRVQYRFQIGFESDSIRLHGDLASIATLKKIAVRFNYYRYFSPGILVTERWTRDPMTGQIDEPGREQVEDVSSALTMLPISGTRLTARVTEFDLDVNIYRVNPITLAEILIALGHAALALQLTTEMMLFALSELESTIVEKVTATARDKIQDALNNSSIKNALDDQGFMTYAGQGLAESLARALIDKAIDNGDLTNVALDGTGRDRLQDQVWQMVFVSSGHCKAILRDV